MTSLLYADSGTPASPAQPSPLVSLMPLLVIFVIFYFLLIRPQQKKMSVHKKMVESLKPGDKVITSSGFYATVVSVGETTAEIKIADNVKVKVLKNSITEVMSSENPAVPAKTDKGTSPS